MSPAPPDAPPGPAGSFRWLRLVAYAAVALVVIAWIALGVRALLGCAARRAPAARAEPEEP